LETTYIIPESVTKIEGAAFYECRLIDMTIPNGVTSIETSAFTICRSLSSITLPDNLARLGSGAFRGCGNLTDIAIPSSLTKIEDGVFSSTGLTKVTIPESITEIGGGAFGSCRNLTSVFIPESVINIESGAFQGCEILTNITIPSSVTSIGVDAFSYCRSLASVFFQGDAPSIYDYYGDVFFSSGPFFIYYWDGNVGFDGSDWVNYSVVPVDENIYPVAPWLLAHGCVYDESLGQDLNGDGVCLLMAYGLNLNPNQNLAASLPIAELGPDKLSMRFYAGVSGINYVVETSSDMVTWSDDIVNQTTPDAEGMCTATVSRNSHQCFLRLVLTED